MLSAADVRGQFQVRFGMYDMLKASRPAICSLVFAPRFPGKLLEDVETLSRASAASLRDLSARRRRPDPAAILSSE